MTVTPEALEFGIKSNRYLATILILQSDLQFYGTLVY